MISHLHAFSEHLSIGMLCSPFSVYSTKIILYFRPSQKLPTESFSLIQRLNKLIYFLCFLMITVWY